MFKPTTDPSLTEEEQVEADKAKVKRANDKRDMQRLIRTVLASPLTDGPMLEVDGKRPLDSFKKKNSDVQTRIIINAALDAAAGDDKARAFIFKYGGYEPVKEQSLTVELPTFVDDMTDDSESVPEQNTIADMDVYDEDA